MITEIWFSPSRLSWNITTSWKPSPPTQAVSALAQCLRCTKMSVFSVLPVARKVCPLVHFTSDSCFSRLPEAVHSSLACEPVESPFSQDPNSTTPLRHSPSGVFSTHLHSCPIILQMLFKFKALWSVTQTLFIVEEPLPSILHQWWERIFSKY